MIKRAFLISNENVYLLSSKITIIGREFGNLLIQNNSVDSKHAIIEYVEDIDGFILKDMNSTHGTFINDYRIQNESTKLSHADIIKFGLCTEKYEFSIEDYQRDIVETKTGSSLPSISNPFPSPIHVKYVPTGSASWTKFPRALSSDFRNGRSVNENLSKSSQRMPQMSGSRNSLITEQILDSGSAKYSILESSERAIITELQREIDRLKCIESQGVEKTSQINELIKENSELKDLIKKITSEKVLEEMKLYTAEVFQKTNSADNEPKMTEKLPGKSSRSFAFDLGFQRFEAEKIRKDLLTSNKLVTTLQKDLSNRDLTINKLTKNIEELNQNISEKDVSISSLIHNLSHLKEAQEQIQKEEMEKLDKEQQFTDMKLRLNTTERTVQEKEEEIERLTKLVDQMHKSAKVSVDNVRDLGLKLMESQSLVTDLQSSECILRVAAQKWENKYTTFRSEVNRTVCVALQIVEDNLSDFNLLDLITKLTKIKTESDACMKTQESEICKLRIMMDGMDVLIKILNEPLVAIFASRTSISIRAIIDSFQSVPEVDSLQPLRNLLRKYLESDLEFVAQLESCIASVDLSLSNLDVLEGVQILIARYKDATESKSRIEYELDHVTKIHEEEIKALNRKHVDNMEEERSGAELRISLAESEREHRERFVNDYEGRVKEQEIRIEVLRKAVSDKDLDYQENLRLSTDKIENVEQQLKTVIDAKNLLEQSMETSVLECKSEIDACKEEICRHVDTIIDLRNLLTKTNKDNKDLHNMLNKRLEKKKKDSKEVCDSPIAVKRNVDNELSVLKKENIMLKKKVADYDKLKTWTNHNAQPDDAIGKAANQNEVETLRCKLSKMAEVVDSLTVELTDLKTKNGDFAKEMEEDKIILSETESGCYDNNCKISTELVAIGSQCRGERHIQIIESQKMALAELRQKMRSMDMTRFQDNNIQAFTKQILQLKKEIAELRANRALDENEQSGGRSLAAILQSRITTRKEVQAQLESEKCAGPENKEIDKSTNDCVGMTRAYKQMAFEIDMIKSAHFDLQQSFEFSETCYIHSIQQIFGALDIDLVTGSGSFDNLSVDAKIRLRREREEQCSKIVQKIIILKEMIVRKDELLQSYERDLVKLKQAEDLSAISQVQVEELMRNNRSTADEVEMLRETLSRTKDLLNQEQRVNTAIKRNEMYKPERCQIQSRPPTDTSKHNCLLENVSEKEKENKMSDKIKRKDYEIQILRRDLNDKDRRLTQAINRLNSLEITLGITSEDPME